MWGEWTQTGGRTWGGIRTKKFKKNQTRRQATVKREEQILGLQKNGEKTEVYKDRRGPRGELNGCEIGGGRLDHKEGGGNKKMLASKKEAIAGGTRNALHRKV